MKSEKKTPRDKRFLAIVLIGIVVISVYAFWNFGLPLLNRYEKPELEKYCWVANDQGEVRQAFVCLWNNGTQYITINRLWIDGAQVNSTDWEGSGATPPNIGFEFYVVSKTTVFQKDQDYNFTLDASSGNQYSFTLRLQNDTTRVERTEIVGCYFYHWPPGSANRVIGLSVKTLGGTVVIIKRMRVNNTPYEITPRLWLGPNSNPDDIEREFAWIEGKTYTVVVETEAGSTAEVTATAD